MLLPVAGKSRRTKILVMSLTRRWVGRKPRRCHLPKRRSLLVHVIPQRPDLLFWLAQAHLSPRHPSTLPQQTKQDETTLGKRNLRLGLQVTARPTIGSFSKLEALSKIEIMTPGLVSLAAVIFIIGNQWLLTPTVEREGRNTPTLA